MQIQHVRIHLHVVNLFLPEIHCAVKIHSCVLECVVTMHFHSHVIAQVQQH